MSDEKQPVNDPESSERESSEPVSSGQTPSDPAPGEQGPAANSEYTPEDLERLSDLEHVRERPALYIGDTTPRGLHHLVYEVVDTSIDEA
ncbi:MAG: DNA gyrase subunit B, partial [Planctomycetes bacterium]|nr:DNA gyrase subunit B [Planctomycetota bacterium]